jgi:acetyl-CoA acetyltransferase
MPGTRFGPDAFRMQFENPFGLAGPPTGYALAAARHMHEYGTTSEQLAGAGGLDAEVGAAEPARHHARPLTVEDVLASRMISWPLHLLDCCLVTDAGGAVVLTSAERARDLPKKPVYVLGTGEASTHVMRLADAELRVLGRGRDRVRARVRDGRRDARGHRRRDVLRRLHDRARHGARGDGLLQPGEGGAFVSGGRTAPGGPFPMNTNGGGLSYTHSGMYGMFTLVEAVRQLRGECGPRQVADCRIALCHGLGGMFSAAATLIAGTEVP